MLEGWAHIVGRQPQHYLRHKHVASEVTTRLSPTCVLHLSDNLSSNRRTQGAGGIAGVIRFINGSKMRMTQLKHELAAATNRFRQGYQDENVLLSMVLEGDRKFGKYGMVHDTRTVPHPRKAPKPRLLTKAPTFSRRCLTFPASYHGLGRPFPSDRHDVPAPHGPR